VTVQRKIQATDADSPEPDSSEHKLPNPEQIQPLRLGAGRVRAWGIALVVVVAALILYVLFYGLNSPNPVNHATSPASTQNTKPQASGNSGAPTPGPPRANQSGVKG
jgi:hypothetical protein